MTDMASDLIGRFYDGAMDSGLWLRAFEELGDALGGAAFVMSVIHRSEGVRFIVASGQDPDCAALIATQYATATTNPLVAAMTGLQPGSLIHRKSIYPDAAYFREALWNEVFRPQKLAHAAVACVLRTDEYVVPLGMLGPTGRGDFSTSELRLLAAVLPHVQRAMKLALRITGLEGEARLTAEMLDRLPTGLILTDSRCRALHLNRSAQQILAARDGFQVTRGMLRAESRDDTSALAAAVARVVRQPSNGSETLALRRKSQRRPYLLLVAPVSSESPFTIGDPGPRALIMLNDPERLPVNLPRQLVETFRLSPTEAQLAAALLTGGKRLEELADERGVSVNTVKTHMKSIFLKTNTDRQSDLVRLLTLLPATH